MIYMLIIENRLIKYETETYIDYMNIWKYFINIDADIEDMWVFETVV